MKTTINTSEPGLQMLPLADIVISETNPRKTFDQDSLNELTKSVHLNGILQPILVRIKDGKFELVCGERRYRASKQVAESNPERNAIPAIIRNLSDDEAFEMQIIENLERKDVHPLEESDAFNRMLESDRYTMADIAAKMAKPETYIAQRLKLASLVPELREHFTKGIFGVGHAVLMARCTPEKQNSIYQDAVRWDKKNPNYGTLSRLSDTITNDFIKIKMAVFSLEDENLVPGCSSCVACPKRSSNSPVLFADQQSEDKCLDKQCFYTKTKASVRAKVVELVESGSNVWILNSYYDVDPEISAFLKSHSVPIRKSYHDYYDYQRDGFTKHKGLVIAGEKAGKIISIWIKPEVAKVVSSDPDPAQHLKDQLSNIKLRMKRGDELDEEKIVAAVQSIDKKAITQGSVLDTHERMAFAVAMYEAVGGDYYYRKNYLPAGFKFDPDFVASGDVPDVVLNILARNLVLDKLRTNKTSFKKSIAAAGYVRFIETNFPDQVAEIRQNQKTLSDKRIANAEKKMLAIQAQIDEIKPEKVVKSRVATKRAVKPNK